jgi:predicted amidohydrolase
MQQGKIGRPVRITSIGFKNGNLYEVSNIVDREGERGTDIIVLPEMWRGAELEPETLEGVTVTAMARLSKKHNTI